MSNHVARTLDQGLVDRVVKNVSEQEIVQLTSDLVNIPSPTGHERACAAFLVAHLNGLGLKSFLQEVEDDRANAIGVLEGTGEGPTLLFNGHLDTSWTGIEREDYPTTGPLGPGHLPRAFVKDDHVFGLGTLNMKGALASTVAAAAALKRAGIPLKGNVIVTGVAGEIEKGPVDGLMRSYRGPEYRGAGIGVRYLVTHGVTADFAIVVEGGRTSLGGEPSFARSTLGFLHVKITAKGRAVYTTGKARGRNAVLQMAQVAGRLEEWGVEYTRRHTVDFGDGVAVPNVVIGAIDGGWPYKPNFVPARCCLYLDIRTVPGQSALDVEEELRGCLARLQAADPELDLELEVYLSKTPALLTDERTYVLGACRRAHAVIYGSPPGKCLVDAGNDGNVFRQVGIPTLCHSPGWLLPDPPQSSEGEFISIQRLCEAAKVYALAALDVCTKTRAEVGLA